MTWTYEEIKRDWLAGGRIPVSPEDMVDAFNRTQCVLGREWIDRSRGQSGHPPPRGTSPTLRIVSMGQRLASLDGVAGAEKLTEGLRRGDQSGEAELTAIYLLRSPGITFVELYPKVSVGTKTREPDFRIRQPDDGSWTYIEVTQPNVSQAQNRVESVLHQLMGPIESVKKPFALEVFLRREPTDIEVALIKEKVLQVCLLEGVIREECPDGLGLLLLNHSQPGRVTLESHSGEERRPRLGAAKTISGPNEPKRHIAVRIPFADQRAEAFLRAEARQLPNDAPGLIMVQMSGAPGGFKSWEALIRQRFQPDLHTRVSGVCLFRSGLLPTGEGEAWLPETKLLVNPHAKRPLPLWIRDTLKEAGAQYERLVGP